MKEKELVVKEGVITIAYCVDPRLMNGTEQLGENLATIEE